MHNLSHNGFGMHDHDYGNPYGNYHKGGVNGLAGGTLGMKSSISTNGFVFKDTTDDKNDINIRINPLQDEASYESRSRTLSSTTFLGTRSMSTRDIMRRTSSISQHSLHHSNNIQNNIMNGGIAPPNNNLNEPEANQMHNVVAPPLNGFVLNTIERGRRGRASGHFHADEQHPNAFGSHAKINHRSTSFTRLNGTLERRRKSRTDLNAVVDTGTIDSSRSRVTAADRDECQPMLLASRCNGTAPNNNGHAVIMQSSC